MTTNQEIKTERPASSVPPIAPIKPLKADLSKRCFELAGEMPLLMRQWPKITRMGLGRKLEEHAYKLLDDAVIVTNPTVSEARKIAVLETMSSSADAVLVYLRLGYMGKEISGKLYERMAGHVVEIGKQVGALGKYLAKNQRNRSQPI